MSLSTDTFESLASRHLDGELTADQQAQFYRRIMREPQLRRQAETIGTLEQRASRALHALLDAPSRPVSIDDLPRQRATHRWMRLQLLATAALVMLAVGVWQRVGMQEQVDTQQTAALNLDSVHAPASAAPKLHVPATYATTDEASLALTPPKMPDVTLASALSSAPMGDRWWRKNRTPPVVASQIDPTTVSISAPVKTASPHRYWSTLLEAIDPAGKRFQMLSKQPVPRTQPVVNSVSGEL